MSEPIINGRVALDDASTVAIDDANGNLVCSGAVVSVGEQSLVATAAHCVDFAAFIAGGVDALNPDFVTPITERKKDARYPEDTRYDVGILSAPGIPTNWARLTLAEEPESLLGKDVRISGYGLVEFGGTPNHQRESISIPVDDESDVTFGYSQTTGGPCSGDSGGPAVDPSSGTLLGITSSGDVFCKSYGVSVKASLIPNLLGTSTSNPCGDR